MYCSAFLLGLAAIVAAMDPVPVPACAVACVEALMAEHTPCSTGDISCICSYEKELHQSDCVIAACGKEKAEGKFLVPTHNLSHMLVLFVCIAVAHTAFLNSGCIALLSTNLRENFRWWW